jgi:hypothetical protein
VLIFVYIVCSIPYAKIKKLQKFKHAKFFLVRVTFDLPHTVASAAAGANDVSVSVLCQGSELFTDGSSQNTRIDMVASHHRFN